MTATGISARRTERPVNLAEARDAMRDTGALLFTGGGTKLGWGAPPARVDTVLNTGRMDALLAHNPGDATARVQAGMPLGRLQAELSRSGQWFAIDPPGEADGATVGGILAANDAGPQRLRYGTMRDLVIGVTVVLSDGAIARSGGNVIKNVAGYDLAKLLCGSLGTLGLIAEVALRLHPLPPHTATVQVEADAARAGAVALALMASQVEPSALDWALGSLWIRFDGVREAIDAQVAATRAMLADHGLGDGALLEASEGVQAWTGLEDEHAGRRGETVARAGTPASRLAEAAVALEAAAAGTGVAAMLASHAASGAHTARLSGGDAAAHAEVVKAWRARLEPIGGHVVIRRRVEGLDDPDVVWGPPPSALGLMRQVKAQLDPGNRCAAGRFVGGL